MKYFININTIDDVKARFKELAKKLHPDCGGDAEEFKAMMNEYKIVFEQYKNIHVTKDGETYEKETTETPEQFADIINNIIHFEDVTIEIIGSWIWLSGNTLKYKDVIKEAGFFWSKSKRAWYYNGEKTKSRRRGRYSMNQLRDKWGAQEVKTEKQEKLTA